MNYGVPLKFLNDWRARRLMGISYVSIVIPIYIVVERISSNEIHQVHKQVLSSAVSAGRI